MRCLAGNELKHALAYSYVQKYFSDEAKATVGEFNTLESRFNVAWFSALVSEILRWRGPKGEEWGTVGNWKAGQYSNNRAESLHSETSKDILNLRHAMPKTFPKSKLQCNY